MNDKVQRNSSEGIKNRLLAVGLILAEIGCMIGYGLAGRYQNSGDLNKIPLAGYGGYDFGGTISLLLMFIFTLVGFGMLLNVYKYGNWLGAGTAIIVVAISILLGPLLQKFWFSVFFTKFKDYSSQEAVDVNGSPPFASNIAPVWWTYASNTVVVNNLMIRTALLSSISILVVMTAVVGRITLFQIIKFTTLYHIFWPLNYYLLIWFLSRKQDFHGNHTDPYYFDMFGTTYVYLFAVFYGIPFSCLSKKPEHQPHPPAVSSRNQFNRLSLLFSQIGTGFIIALFVFTSCYIIQYPSIANVVARFSILFGIMGSIIGTYIGSGICGGGRVGYKQTLTGAFAGAIVMGAVAPLLYNIGIIIMIGTVTGIFSGIYMAFIHPKLNRTNLYDVLGLFGPFAIAAILGSLVVVPSTIIDMYRKHRHFAFTYVTDNTAVQIYGNYAAYQLIYVGLSAAIGLGGGLVATLLNCCDDDNYVLTTNQRIFDQKTGLYDDGPAYQTQGTPLYHYPPPSQQQINNSNI